jgi:hypothetical protein
VCLVGLDRIAVRLVHHAAQIDIVAEVGTSNRLILVSLELVVVRFIDDVIAVHVTDEEAKCHIIRPATAVTLETSRSRSVDQPLPETGTGLEGSISLHNISVGPIRQGVPDSKPLANTTVDAKEGNLTIASSTTDDQGRFRNSFPRALQHFEEGLEERSGILWAF